MNKEKLIEEGITLMSNLKKLGEYKGVPVYQDLTKTDTTSGWRARGPIEEHKNINQPGMVYMNFETGETTLPNGEKWVPLPVTYETKSYVVGNDNLEDAIFLIENGTLTNKL